MNILWWIFPIAVASAISSMMTGAYLRNRLHRIDRIDTGYPEHPEKIWPEPEPPKITALSIEEMIAMGRRKPKVRNEDWMK